MPELCDYGAIRTDFSPMFGTRRKCVISGDLDGVFSAVLLGHLFEWEVVGFYTLKDLWIPPSALGQGCKNPEFAISRANLVFVDHDIYRAEIDSVGHHLLQWSPETPIPLHKDGRGSLNPNLLRGITKKEFNRKYPFSTFHFLIACASARGLVKDFHPDDEITTLMLQIDSSFVNAINYQENALDWLQWLGGSEEQSPLYPICRRMLRFTPRTMLEQFRNLAQRFTSLGIRPRSQATLTDPTDEDQLHTLRNLTQWFEAETGWRSRFAAFDAGQLAHYAMARHSCLPRKSDFISVIQRKPFSYAIIGSGEGGLNYNWFQGFEPK
jgi:hypothetical protein